MNQAVHIERIKYEKPECEITIIKPSSQLLQNSIEPWGEEDLFDNDNE